MGLFHFQRQNLGIHLRRAQILVAQEFLDEADIHPLLKQMRGAGPSEGMR